MNIKTCVVDLHGAYMAFSRGNGKILVRPASQGIPNIEVEVKPFVHSVMTSVESALSTLKDFFSAYEDYAFELLKVEKEKQDLAKAPESLLEAQNKISKQYLETIVDSFSRALKEIDEEKCANDQLKPALQEAFKAVKLVIKEGRKQAFSVLYKVAFKRNLTPKVYRKEIEEAENILKTSVSNAKLEVDKLLERFSKEEGSVVCHLLPKKRLWIELNGEEFKLRTDALLETFPKRTEVIIGDGIDQLRLVVKKDDAGLKAKLSPIPFLEKNQRVHLVKEFKTLCEVKYGLKFEENPLIQGIVSALSQEADFCNFYEVLKFFKDPQADHALTSEQKKSIFDALIDSLNKSKAVNKDVSIALLCKVAKKDSKLKSQWYRWYVWKTDVHYGENLFQKFVIQGAAKETLKQWKEYPIAAFVESHEKISECTRKLKNLFLKNQLEQKEAEVEKLKSQKKSAKRGK